MLRTTYVDIWIWVTASLLSAGAVGYALAHARAGRKALIATCCGLVLAYGTAAALFSAGIAPFPPSASMFRASNGSANPLLPTLTTPHQSSPTPVGGQPLLQATDAWLRFQSDAGDYIGSGKSELWTLTESDFSIRGDNHEVQATASGKGDYWQLWFRAPSNGVLRVAAFTNAERAPFVTGKAPGLDIFGSGRGCNTLSGQFDVKRVGWAANGDVVSIDVVFEQHCEGMVPALRGELWITTQAGVHKPLPNMSSPITF